MTADPLRPEETDYEPVQPWLADELALYNDVRRRERSRRRNAMWLMLLCFTAAICIAAAAYVGATR